MVLTPLAMVPQFDDQNNDQIVSWRSDTTFGPKPTHTTTTVAIRRLEKLGLVKRSRDPSDLRAVLVDITPKGLSVHRESLANRRAALAAMLSRLSEDDLETLTKALAPLERLAERTSS